MCQEGQFPAEEAVALGGGGEGGKLWCWAGGEVNCGAGRGGGTTRKTQNSWTQSIFKYGY